jgi:hypothetical protein
MHVSRLYKGQNDRDLSHALGDINKLIIVELFRNQSLKMTLS